jgi:hypothetical protein
MLRPAGFFYLCFAGDTQKRCITLTAHRPHKVAVIPSPFALVGSNPKNRLWKGI